jgi:precorrin-3B methylase
MCFINFLQGIINNSDRDIGTLGTARSGVAVILLTQGKASFYGMRRRVLECLHCGHWAQQSVAVSSSSSTVWSPAARVESKCSTYFRERNVKFTLVRLHNSEQNKYILTVPLQDVHQQQVECSFPTLALKRERERIF